MNLQDNGDKVRFSRRILIRIDKIDVDKVEILMLIDVDVKVKMLMLMQILPELLTQWPLSQSALPHSDHGGETIWRKRWIFVVKLFLLVIITNVRYVQAALGFLYVNYEMV